MFHDVIASGNSDKAINHPVVVLEKDGTGRIEELAPTHVGAYACVTIAGRRIGRLIDNELDIKELMYQANVAFAFGESFDVKEQEKPRNNNYWHGTQATFTEEDREAIAVALRTYVEKHLPHQDVDFRWRNFGDSRIETVESDVRLVNVSLTATATVNNLPWDVAATLATLQDHLLLSSLDTLVCGAVRSVQPLEDAMITSHRSGSPWYPDHGLEVRIHKNGPIVGKLFVSLSRGGITMTVNNATAGKLDAASAGRSALNDFHGIVTRAAIEQNVKDIQHLVHNVLYPYIKATQPAIRF